METRLAESGFVYLWADQTFYTSDSVHLVIKLRSDSLEKHQKVLVPLFLYFSMFHIIPLPESSMLWQAGLCLEKLL